MSKCNADYQHPCDVNDGEPCDGCAEWLAASRAEAWREWLTLSPEQRHPKRYGYENREEAEAAELRAAGRP